MALSCKGFTLVEVLAALVLFLITLVGLSSLLTTTMQANAQAKRITTATNLAQDKLEEVRNTAYSSVSSGSDSAKLTETGGTSGSGAIYTRSWTVTADSPAAGTKTVTATVTWTDQTGSHTVQLQTIVAQ
jgi:prepilin-type N-terminal cleavage/methylation domain-containing protein